MLCNKCHFCLGPRYCHHPKGNPYLLSRHIYIPYIYIYISFPLSLETTNLYSMSMDLPILGISYKWSHDDLSFCVRDLEHINLDTHRNHWVPNSDSLNRTPSNDSWESFNLFYLNRNVHCPSFTWITMHSVEQ